MSSGKPVWAAIRSEPSAADAASAGRLSVQATNVTGEWTFNVTTDQGGGTPAQEGEVGLVVLEHVRVDLARRARLRLEPDLARDLLHDVHARQGREVAAERAELVVVEGAAGQRHLVELLVGGGDELSGTAGWDGFYGQGGDDRLLIVASDRLSGS